MLSIFTKNYYLILVATLVVILGKLITAQHNPDKHILYLDNEGKYVLEWQVNWSNRTITFTILVACNSCYIGFGFSPRGMKSGADLIIGGVDITGVPYLIDMHGSSFNGNVPVHDLSQDYVLSNAWENGTHTSLQFNRPFKTCDESGEDYDIDHNTVVLLWCYGKKDDYSRYHYENRGKRSAHLLDPDWTPKEFQEASLAKRVASSSELSNHDLKVWTLTRRQLVPEMDTVYWCSIHKGPQLDRKHHLVGFNFRWQQEIEFNRTHHMLLFRCQAPEGTDPVEFFEPYVQNNTGEMCFFFLRGQSEGLPLQYCRELVYAYAVGAKMFFLPEHAGIPFGDSPNEYYALQVHYDNYDIRADLEYSVNIDLYYTENLRKNEAGIFSTGHNIPGSPSILIPPGAKAHSIHGHCGNECTNQILPPEGINVMAVEQHTHLSGRRHRLQNFRNDREMPWIANDDNYNGNFQAVRMLRRESHVMPGDQLVTRCVFDNTWTNGSVVGGFSTRQEMCLLYIWYYNKLVDHSQCRSEILEEGRYAEKYLRIKNSTWNNELLEYIVTDPVELAGMTISQVADNQVEWSIEKRKELQEDHTFLPQRSLCPSLRQLREGTGEGVGTLVEYPVGVNEYIPETIDSCSGKSQKSRKGMNQQWWGWDGRTGRNRFRGRSWNRRNNYYSH